MRTVLAVVRAIFLPLPVCLFTAAAFLPRVGSAAPINRGGVSIKAPTTALDSVSLQDPTVAAPPKPGDSKNVAVIGSWLFGPSYDVTVENSIAYFGDGVVMNVMDFSIPTAPVMRDRVVLEGEIWDIAVVGNYAYVAAESGGFRIVNVTDTNNAFEVAKVSMDGVPLDVAVSGNFAYVAAWGAGLCVIDVSDPLNPFEVGHYTQPDIRGVAVSSSHAYTIGGFDGLHALDISNPAVPTQVGYRPTFDGVDLVAVGNRVYVAGSPLRIVDVTDPTQPAQLGSIGVGSGQEVVVAGKYAYRATVSAAVIVDISDPAHPVQVGAFDPSREVYGVAVSGNLLFVANYINGLYVRDVSNPSNPVLVYHYDTADDLLGVATAGNFVYLADRYYGLKVIDASDPARLEVAGSLDTGSWAASVSIVGDLAYVADGADGLRIIDVSDPAHMFEVGSFETGGWVSDVAVLGEYAYVADLELGLRIVDVTNPASPIEVGFFNDFSYDGDIYGLAVVPGYVLLAAGVDGFRVVDVTDPSNPIEVPPAIPEQGFAWDVTVDADLAYVSMSTGLRIVELRLPAYWYDSGFATTSGVRLAVSGGIAYLASSSSGVRVVDATDPPVAAEVGFYMTSSFATDVATARGYAFAASEGEGLFTLQYMRPVPVTLQSFDLLPTPTGIHAEWVVREESNISDYCLYRANAGIDLPVDVTGTPIPADGRARYQFLDKNVAPGTKYRYTLVTTEWDGETRILASDGVTFEGSGSVALEQNRPNPFNPTTIIRFVLPVSEHVTLAIYDANGRLVRTLVNEVQGYGAHEAAWDGRDSAGVAIGSGVYFYRLRAGKRTESRKMVLLK